jgi:hypothetical protein
MGNSDSKTGKQFVQTTPSSKALAQEYMMKVQNRLEAEFDKRADIQSNTLTRDSFQACLRKVQEEFGLFNISGSPLGIGLFESSAVSHPDGKVVLTKSEYASAMSLLFHHCEQSLLISATTQAILRWYASTKGSTGSVYTKLTDEILVSFFEASWRFAWNELIYKKLSSNSRLNGKSETEAIQRFSESHLKYFSSHPAELKLYDPSSASAPTVDKCITARVGDDYVVVPTSFSFVTRLSATSPKGSGRFLCHSPADGRDHKNQVLYPDL